MMLAKNARRPLALTILFASACLCFGCRFMTPEDGIFQLAAPDFTLTSVDGTHVKAEFGVGWSYIDNLVIRYTTDGTDPTASTVTTLYTGYSGTTIAYSGTLTLKARCFMDGYEPSTVVTKTYP